MNWLTKLLARGLKTTKSTQTRRARAGVRLAFEVLEDRQLLAGGLATTGLLAQTLPPSPSTSATLDMTTVAKMYPTHSGPTTLYLNFDGWTDYDRPLFQAEAKVYGYNAAAAGIVYDVGQALSDAYNSLTGGHNSTPHHNISAFQTTTGDRDRDIQEIIYRVSEIYAPFNVQVRRIMGDGNYSQSNGNTTIFIGKDSGTSGADSYTPAAFVDISGKTDYGPFPILNAVSTVLRAPNTDPFDIAFADRQAQSGNVTISQSIAHEAGHTFGLAHVRVDGLTDPTTLNYPANGARDIMSYDSANEAFVNQTLTITDFNNTGAPQAVIDKSLHPTWNGLPIAQQNSFTYLQAVLGCRPADDAINVADPLTINAPPSAPQLVSVGAVLNKSIERLGDYDVYQLASNPAVSKPLYISVQSTSGGVDPVLMVYAGFSAADLYHGDFEFFKLIQFSNDRASNDNSSVLILAPSAIQSAISVKLVVGASQGASTGGYRLRITDQAPDLAAKSINFQLLSQTGPGAGRVRITGIVANAGNIAYMSSTPATAVLIESINGHDSIVARQDLTNVAPGQQIALTYDRDWAPPAPPNVGSLGTGGSPVVVQTPGSSSNPTPMAPTAASTPGTPTLVDVRIPIYRLEIRVAGFNAAGVLMDGSSANNQILRSGSDIMALFTSTPPAAAAPTPAIVPVSAAPSASPTATPPAKSPGAASAAKSTLRP